MVVVRHYCLAADGLATAWLSSDPPCGLDLGLGPRPEGTLRSSRARPSGFQGQGGWDQVLVEIDGREVRTEADLHRLLRRALDFGPYYGSNLDALRDRLRLDVPRPVRVIWTHWQISRRNLGAKRFAKICDLLRAVEAEDQESGHEERFEFDLQ